MAGLSRFLDFGYDSEPGGVQASPRTDGDSAEEGLDAFLLAEQPTVGVQVSRWPSDLASLGQRGRKGDDSSDSDVAGHDGVDTLIYGACQPAAGGEGLATHVVLKVSRITNISRTDAGKTNLPPGRMSAAHFLDCRPETYQLCTASVVHFDEVPRYPMKPRRCAEPRAQLQDLGPSRRLEAYWHGQSGEVRVRLRNAEQAIHCGLVIGGEVVGVTRALSLYGALRRFFQEHEVFRPGHAGAGEPIAIARVAIELWPPGSVMPEELEAGHGTDEDIRLFPVSSTRAAPGLVRECAARQDGIIITADGVDAGLSIGRLPCHLCDGIGRRPCGSCQGHGALVCQACDGMPPLPCGHCNGKGVEEDGLETIAGLRGGILSASAGKRCMVCWGSPVCCGVCFGVGGLRCATCSGAGWLSCSCGSTGRMWV